MEQLNYIPKKEFLRLMNITRWTFTEWVTNHKLPIIRIGYRTFIPFDQYQIWVKDFQTNIPHQSEVKEQIDWKSIF
jgi:hypothetical protein